MEPTEEPEGLMCMLDHNEVCSPACMAYVTRPQPAKATELTEQQQHCLLLGMAERVGRSLVVLANTAAAQERAQRVAREDEVRRERQVVPERKL